MEELNIDKSSTIFVGDMTSDVKAGKAAGIYTIAVATGLVPKERLGLENPDLLLTGTDELCAQFNSEL